MAEENLQNQNITPTRDDLSVLRVLLHSIKGISPVSTSVDAVDLEDTSV